MNSVHSGNISTRAGFTTVQLKVLHNMSQDTFSDFIRDISKQQRCYSSFEMLRKEEGNVLFNDALNTFYLRLHGVRHMVKDHSYNEKGNPLPPHGLLFPISSKSSFICIIPQTG